MGGKDKIGPGIREPKTQFPQRPLDPLPGCHDPADDLPKIRLVPQGLHSQRQRGTVYGVGIKRKLHIAEIFDQFLAAYGITHPQTGHGPGLAECLHHQKIVIFLYEGKSALTAKVNIGFIHNHHHIPIGPQDLLHQRQRLVDPGGSIGIGKNHPSVGTPVILRANVECLVQRTGLIGNPVQLGPHVIEGIGDIGKQDGPVPVEKSQKGHGQHIIGPHAHKYLLLLHPIIICQFPGQRLRAGIGIQTQILRLQGLYGRPYPGSRRIGAFIGVKFDHIRSIRLFPGHIGDHPADIFFPLHMSLSPCLWYNRADARTFIIIPPSALFVYYYSSSCKYSST